MRTILCLAFVLLTNTLMAQDANTTLPPSFFTSGPAIEEGAFRAKYEETLAQVEVQKRMIDDLRLVIKTLEAKRCPCCESGECQCGKNAAPIGKITMVSMDGCKACPVAEAYHGPRYQAAGWAWSTRSDGKGRPGMWYPYYEVCIGDSCTVIQCRDIYDLDARMNDLIASRNQQPVHDKRGRFLGNW